MWKRLKIASWAVLLAMAACGPDRPVTPQTVAREPAPATGSAAGKNITLAVPAPVKGFGVWDINTAGGAASVWELHSMGLVTNDESGRLVGRLGARLPNLADGSMVLLPDGRMQTTWVIRPGVKWQDGVPFTAEDLAFASEVVRDPEIPGEKSASGKYIEQVEARDPQTAVITWKAPFFRANALTLRELWPMPSHLLRDAFRADKNAFMNLPYWTADYVHLGPFRLVDFGLGETLVFERFDDYFLGRPKLHKIVFQTIRDPNAIFASMRAGAIDMTTELSLPPDLGARLRDEWATSGEGILLQRQGAWRYLKVQFDQDVGRPAELSRDVHVRRGLMFGLDRDAIRAAVFPGFNGTESDTFMLGSDPRAAAVGKPFSRYPYDPNRASQELAEAGWNRGPDGRMVSSTNQLVQIPIRSTAPFYTEMAISAAGWRDLGLDVAEEIAPPGADAEYRAKFPGITATARGTGDTILPNFDSRAIPKPSNRYTGQNLGAYANPAMDRLIDSLSVSIDEADQGRLLARIADILAEDLPALPIYSRVEMVAKAKGIRALDNDYAGADNGTVARHAHLWDRD